MSHCVQIVRNSLCTLSWSVLALAIVVTLVSVPRAASNLRNELLDQSDSTKEANPDSLGTHLQTTIVTGRVIDAVTKQPVEFVTVEYMGQCGFTGTLDSANSLLIDFTDSVGAFSFVTQCVFLGDTAAEPRPIRICGNMAHFYENMNSLLVCKCPGYLTLFGISSDDLFGNVGDIAFPVRTLGPYLIELEPDTTGASRGPMSDGTPISLQKLNRN